MVINYNVKKESTLKRQKKQPLIVFVWEELRILKMSERNYEISTGKLRLRIKVIVHHEMSMDLFEKQPDGTRRNTMNLLQLKTQ